jgi:hypothetical protein
MDVTLNGKNPPYQFQVYLSDMLCAKDPSLRWDYMQGEIFSPCGQIIILLKDPVEEFLHIGPAVLVGCFIVGQR